MDFVRLLLGAGMAMAATSLGAAGVIAFRRISARLYAWIISFCAGMMAFSSLEMFNEAHVHSGHRIAFGSLLAGLLVFSIVGRLLPHAHALLLGNEMPGPKRKAALLAGTITIHNIPEGFAIASAFAQSPALGWLVAICIALQDVPEGLMVAAPVACYGVSTRRSFFWGVFSGVAEFTAAIAGFLFLRSVSSVTPLALGFSAGTMTYVVFFELLPDAVRSESPHIAVGAFVAGIAVAYGLSALIGA